MAFIETEFLLPGITLSAQRWGEGNPIKVIALHGWLDNSASFSWLIPKLSEVDVVALDMAGHAKSEFRTGQGAYNIWQDLPEILQVTEQLGWERFALLGHSRGAMIASLFAGTFPERVNALVLLDAVTPFALPESELPGYLESSVVSLLTTPARKSSYYTSFSAALSARMQGVYPLGETASRVLAERGVSRDQRGYYWRYDPRLFIASEIRLSDTQVRAFVDRFSMVAKVIFAENGLYASEQPLWMLKHAHLDVEFLPGGHHLHLSEGLKDMTLLANKINEYLYRSVA